MFVQGPGADTDRVLA